SGLASAYPGRVVLCNRLLLGSVRPGLALERYPRRVAQRVPAVREVPGRLAIRGRIAASVEQHALLAAGAVWAAWLAAVLGVVVAASGVAFLGVAAASPSGQGRRAALALACWPGSFMLLLAYPDVLALAAAAWAAALVLRGRPFLAGALGAVAAVARPTGFLI